MATFKVHSGVEQFCIEAPDGTESAPLDWDEVADLKREASSQIDEFARKREEFMATLQDRNGAKKLEAPEESEV